MKQKTQTTLNAKIVAFYSLEINFFNMDMHHHDELELMYVTAGECSVTTPNKKIELKQGQFIFLNSRVPHQLLIDTKKTCQLMNIEYSLGAIKQGINVAEIFRVLPILQQPPLPTSRTDQGSIGKILKNLINQLNQLKNQTEPDQVNQLMIQLLFQQLLLELGKNLVSEKNTHAISYVKRAVQLINQNLSDSLRIDDIAQAVGVNKSYLQTLFKAETGESMVNYINRQRIQKACFLLINSNLTITDIAFETGFNNRQHFGKIFTTITGMSPKAFRDSENEKKLLNIGTGQFRLEDTAWSMQAWK